MGNSIKRQKSAGRKAQYAAQFARTARNKANRAARIRRRKVQIPHVKKDMPSPQPLPSVQVANPIETFAKWMQQRGMGVHEITAQLSKFSAGSVVVQPPE